MIDLKARSPMEGLLPVTIAGVIVREVDLGPMTVLMPFKGATAALANAVAAAHGFGWPEVGRMTGTGEAGAVWFGREHALLIGVVPDPSLSDHAAVVDQSDAWAVVEMDGLLARDGLARMTPIDLRDNAFDVGQTARTELGHMPASITRIAPEVFRIMVFRAFARTLSHELSVALEGVAARHRY